MKVGLLPLGRATFDVAYAQEKLAAMLAVLDESERRGDHEIVGPRELLMDAEATDAAIDALAKAGIERLLVLQVTFTDAAAICAAVERLDVPVAVWAVPEPRLGGRLRLNAFCGLNLAVHALGLRGVGCGHIYQPPDPDAHAELADDIAYELNDNLNDIGWRGRRSRANKRGRAVVEAIAGKRIARLGEHPDGFDTCRYDAATLKSLAGVEVVEHGIDDLFAIAREVDDVADVRAQAERDVGSLDGVDQEQLTRSLALRTALERMRASGSFDAFAIRCWPETFTQYGGAVCAPVAMMGEKRVPCACEADVYGALTQLVLQEVADAPVFLVDLVDIDEADDTAVVWHCGQAPISMARRGGDGADAREGAGGETAPTIHTNRKQPLLYEFALKPGPVTLMRISQGWSDPKMVLATAEMLDRPRAFTGTSGVMRPEAGADALMRLVMNGAVEHHLALVYGDHEKALRGVAGALGLPVLDAA